MRREAPESKEVKGLLAGLSQQPVEAEGSLIRETPGRAGSSPDNAGTCLALPDGAGPASEIEKVYERNQWLKPRKRGTGSNLADMGRVQCRSPAAWGGGRLRSRLWRAGGEATVNACGVAVAMLPGQSWAPHLVDRFAVNVGTIRVPPPPRAVQPGGGQARRRLRARGGAEAP